MDHRGGGENKGGRKRNLGPREPRKPREGSILNVGRSREPKGEKSILNAGEAREPRGKERSGQAALNAIRYRRALKSYDRRLLDEPLNADLHVGKGEALLGLGRNKDALEAYKEAIRLAPDLSSAYRGQSKVYEQLAQQSYEKARELGVE